AAPASIHFRKAATWAAVRRASPGGIRTSASVEVTRRIISLAAGLPGVTAGEPESPLPSNPPLESKRSPPFCLIGPWHFMQRAARIDRASAADADADTAFADWGKTASPSARAQRPTKGTCEDRSGGNITTSDAGVRTGSTPAGRQEDRLSALQVLPDH